jgi:hypothetical protein
MGHEGPLCDKSLIATEFGLTAEKEESEERREAVFVGGEQARRRVAREPREEHSGDRETADMARTRTRTAGESNRLALYPLRNPTIPTSTWHGAACYFPPTPCIIRCGWVVYTAFDGCQIRCGFPTSLPSSTRSTWRFTYRPRRWEKNKSFMLGRTAPDLCISVCTVPPKGMKWRCYVGLGAAAIVVDLTRLVAVLTR